jgi:hypothetical protein
MTPMPLGTTTPNGPPETPPQACVPLCPLCQGRLVRLRDSMRCVRCGFVLCVGCADGETGD